MLQLALKELCAHLPDKTTRLEASMLLFSVVHYLVSHPCGRDPTPTLALFVDPTLQKIMEVDIVFDTSCVHCPLWSFPLPVPLLRGVLGHLCMRVCVKSSAFVTRLYQVSLCLCLRALPFSLWNAAPCMCWKVLLFLPGGLYLLPSPSCLAFLPGFL